MLRLSSSTSSTLSLSFLRPIAPARFTPSPSRFSATPRSPASPRPHSTGRSNRSRSQWYSTESSASARPPPLPKTGSRLRRIAGFASLAVLAFTLGLGYQTQHTVSRLMAAPMPTDEETLTAFTPPDVLSQEIEDYIRTHPVAEALRANPDFTESRPHMKIPESMRARSLTAGTLAGPNKIVVPPYFFNEVGGKSMVSLMYLGSDICGHPGIVHGGMLATLLDEGLARCCFPALPNKVGVTANLTIDYRAPAKAESYAVLRAETVKVEGRKAWVEGRIETLPKNGEAPVVLVEAKALFIEPKQAAVMASLYRVAS